MKKTKIKVCKCGKAIEKGKYCDVCSLERKEHLQDGAKKYGKVVAAFGTAGAVLYKNKDKIIAGGKAAAKIATKIILKK